ncbi:MAG: HAD-IIB family hydrolase [Bacteriovoracaceae bacterium]|jgi:HAD superfamily hydrolase (TIGR01484 family)|nr:HAD-IIB family hydrolase [Bacteriovoracaceae bacterium]
MKIIFSDFDGTLTSNGLLGAIFFDILDVTNKMNAEFVIVSGRSISWGHFFLTHFDLNYVIMEGGGVLLYKNKFGHICEEVLVYDEDVALLEKITQKIISEVPGCVMSADSFGRKTDRAIEFSQMKKEDIDKVTKILDDSGLHYSKSNVHINFWAGDMSKYLGIKHFLKHYAPHINEEDTIFYGDAKNDESAFEGLQNTVGVSNIIKIIDELTHKPKIVLEGKENSGAAGVYMHLKEIADSSIDF